MDGGAVRIDDSITAYVPSVPQLEDVTLGSLCDSEAGLRSSSDLNWNQILPNPEREWTPREFVSSGLGAGRGRTGSWNDSDTSYFLLGYALENATHTPLAELITNYLTDPQNLNHTELPGSAAAAPGSNALPGFYTSSSSRQAGCEEPPAEYTKISSSLGYADSGIVSTIDDLGSYTARLARQIGDLDDPPARWAGSLPVDADGDQWIRVAGGDRFYGTMVGQEGSILGYSTATYSDINTGVTVAVTLNNSASGGALVGALARELAAIAMTADGKHKPEDAALPWTIEQAHDAVTAAAVCPV
jgi:D-alanyl-D-alanine carboxypeptidase